MRKFEGRFEEYGNRRLELIARLLPENPGIFEAGGHYGYDTIKFFLQWPKAKIISFEANPENFEMLQEKTAWIPNISAYNLAVHSYNGKAFLNTYKTTAPYIPSIVAEKREGSFVFSQVLDFDEKAILNAYANQSGPEGLIASESSFLEASHATQPLRPAIKVEVPCVVLDDWCALNGIPYFDFLWLDLEGLELTVLKSSPNTLKKAKVIYTETNFGEYNIGMTLYPELRSFLEKAGFTMLSHWYEEGWQGNAIFVKNSSIPSLHFS